MIHREYVYICKKFLKNPQIILVELGRVAGEVSHPAEINYISVYQQQTENET